ncbi:unnamed protein product, partial [marine sediment metagenome]
IASPTATWQDGKKYHIKSYATDEATNKEVVVSSNTFIIDVTTPTSGITQPLNNSRVNSLDFIRGTASDTPPGETEIVEISIYDRIDKKYYKNGSFSETSWYFFAAASTDSFHTWYSTSPTWVPGIDYSIWCRATDKAGNQEVVVSSHTFVYDTEEPTSIITYPTDWLVVSEPTGSNLTIEGTASADCKPLIEGGVAVSVRRLSDGNYWQGLDFTNPSEDWRTPDGDLTSWTLDITKDKLNSGTTYFIHSKATDLAGNVEGGGSGNAGLTFLYDKTEPSSGVVRSTVNSK